MSSSVVTASLRVRSHISNLLSKIQGLQRSVVEELSQHGWYNHIYLEHNVYHLLYYLILIDSKQESDCDAIEKYIKNKLDNDPPIIDFIPKRHSVETGLCEDEGEEGGE